MNDMINHYHRNEGAMKISCRKLCRKLFVLYIKLNIEFCDLVMRCVVCFFSVNQFYGTNKSNCFLLSNDNTASITTARLSASPTEPANRTKNSFRELKRHQLSKQIVKIPATKCYFISFDFFLFSFSTHAHTQAENKTDI